MTGHQDVQTVAAKAAGKRLVKTLLTQDNLQHNDKNGKAELLIHPGEWGYQFKLFFEHRADSSRTF